MSQELFNAIVDDASDALQECVVRLYNNETNVEDLVGAFDATESNIQKRLIDSGMAGPHSAAVRTEQVFMLAFEKAMDAASNHLRIPLDALADRLSIACEDEHISRGDMKNEAQSMLSKLLSPGAGRTA